MSDPPKWIRPRAPISGAQNVDFAALIRSGVDTPGTIRQLSLSGVGLMSPGEWTLYILRQTFITEPLNPATPAAVLSIQVQSGTDKGRGDLLGIERTGAGAAVQLYAQSFRGIAFHVAAGTLDASISYLVGTRTSDDSILSWVAPGRPQATRLEGRGATVATVAIALADRLRVPNFAHTIRVQIAPPAVAAVAPAVVFWSGPTLAAVFPIPPAAVGALTSVSLIVPEEATHFAFIDTSGAVNFVWFSFDLES